MDMHDYVANLSLWLWDALGQERAPFPDVTADFDHSHDFCKGPAVALLGARIPDDVRAHFEAFSGERLVEQVISDQPRRVATAWLSERAMIGAEAGDLGVSARGQYHPATVHWDAGEGAVGWIRLEHDAPVSATARPGELVIACRPHHRRGPQPVRFHISAPGEPAMISPSAWSLPGLTVGVRTDAPLLESATGGAVSTVVYDATRDIVLHLR
jgi:hypothetical protein